MCRGFEPGIEEMKRKGTLPAVRAAADLLLTWAIGHPQPPKFATRRSISPLANSSSYFSALVGNERTHQGNEKTHRIGQGHFALYGQNTSPDPSTLIPSLPVTMAITVWPQLSGG
jgi:hypothetical protein